MCGENPNLERERERDFVLSASGFEKERDRYEFG